MVNYEENERALKELFREVKTVPDTLPPVYLCGEIIISYDRRGKIRVIASTKSEQPSEDGWFKRWQARLVPLAGVGGPEQGLIDSWIQRWHGRRWRVTKATDSQQRLGQV